MPGARPLPRCLMRDVGLKGAGKRGGFAAAGYCGGPLAGNAFWRGSPCPGLVRSVPHRAGSSAAVAATSISSAEPVAGVAPWKWFISRPKLAKADTNRRTPPPTGMEKQQNPAWRPRRRPVLPRRPSHTQSHLQMRLNTGAAERPTFGVTWRSRSVTPMIPPGRPSFPRPISRL
jgi:hypothetical protein